MLPNAHYRVDKKDHSSPSSGSSSSCGTSAFLSFKLSATLRRAVEQNPHSSSIEFHSLTQGLLHVGAESHKFTIRKDGKIEMYTMSSDHGHDEYECGGECGDDHDVYECGDECGGECGSGSGERVLWYEGPVAGRVVLQRDSKKTLSSEDSAIIREKTVQAVEESKQRRVMSAPVAEKRPLEVKKRLSLQARSVGLGGKGVGVHVSTTCMSSSGSSGSGSGSGSVVGRKRPRTATATVTEPVATPVASFIPNISKSGVTRRYNHSEIVLRNVPALFSMNDVANFLSGIKLRSYNSGFFVVFLFDDELPAELLMDVYVELESLDGVEVALKRNHEEFTSSCSRCDLECLPLQGYHTSCRNYRARIETVANDEIFCAKNIGIKITVASLGVRLPTITILKELLTSEELASPVLLSALQVRPALLLRMFPRFFTMFQARVKGDKSKRPIQWIEHFDDTSSSYANLEDRINVITAITVNQVSMQHNGSDSDLETLANDLLVIMSNLIQYWSHLLCCNLTSVQDSLAPANRDESGMGLLTTKGKRLLACSDLIGRQILFYHILYNSEVFKMI